MYKVAINRPIATLMYVFTLVIFGYMSFKGMPSALYPNVDFPIVTIKTIYPGVDANTIESQVTQKIEEAVSGIAGVDSIISTSSDSISVVMVNFFLERNIDEATNDVRDKVSAVTLPKNAKIPLVSKLDIGAAPVINVFLTAKKNNIKNKRYAKWFEFAFKTKNKKNRKTDFNDFKTDKTFTDIMHLLLKDRLTQEEIKYITKEEELKEINNIIKSEIGAIALCDDIAFVPDLPKTRSGKIMRRILRSIAKGEAITQDTSTLEDPTVVGQIEDAVKSVS